MRLITDTPFSAIDHLSRFEAAQDNVGAVASFAGYVRRGSDDDPVSALYLEHYPGVCEAEIERFMSVAKTRFAVTDLGVIHRVGHIKPGEAVVLVCASAPHRRAAFEAVDYLMDYLKSRAPFWKKEYRQSGEYWIEPRDEDYADIARWDKNGRAAE